MGVAVAQAPAEGRHGSATVQRTGVTGEAEPAAVGFGWSRNGKAAGHRFAGEQRWTLSQIKTLFGRLFHVGYTAKWCGS